MRFSILIIVNISPLPIHVRLCSGLHGSVLATIRRLLICELKLLTQKRKWTNQQDYPDLNGFTFSRAPMHLSPSVLSLWVVLELYWMHLNENCQLSWNSSESDVFLLAQLLFLCIRSADPRWFPCLYHEQFLTSNTLFCHDHLLLDASRPWCCFVVHPQL